LASVNAFKPPLSLWRRVLFAQLLNGRLLMADTPIDDQDGTNSFGVPFALTP
jgi:hypothetical protein